VTNYTRNEAPDFDKVLEAGEFVFSDDAFDTDLNKPIASRLKMIQETRGSRPKLSRLNWDSDEEEEQKDVQWEVQTRHVAFTPPHAVPAKSVKDKVDDLAQKIHELEITDAAYAVCYTHLAGLMLTAA
jgi:hypothetical protein